MVLGKLSVPGRPTIWIIEGQGPIALAAGAGGGLFGHFYSLYLFSPLSPCLWETVRYRLKCCLKGPLNPKSTKNQILCRNKIVNKVSEEPHKLAFLYSTYRFGFDKVKKNRFTFEQIS